MINLDTLVDGLNNWLWGGPLVIYTGAAAVLFTVGLGFVQFRYFGAAWRLLLHPPKTTGGAEMSSLSAFLNALSASVGNGSIAGMATAVVAGGPGAAFWVFVLGLLSMAFRFAEVFLATYYTAPAGSTVLGGPMIYLARVPGGRWLTSIYAFFCMMLGFAIGCSMQSNSISVALHHSLNIDPIYVAIALFVFIAFVVFGGAQRIIKISDAIVPVKVGIFFISMIIALIYHWAALLPALKLIVMSAFDGQAVAGGAMGYSMQTAMRYGYSRISNASEAGLGTAAIFFGATRGASPVREGTMAMLTTFISANLVCFSTMLLIVASGVWNSGLNSTALTSQAFGTVFGIWGEYIVSFLSITFGLGVTVAYAYITRQCWLYLTNGKHLMIFNVLYVLVAAAGPLASVKIIWNAADVINAGLLGINLFGMWWLLPTIRKELIAYDHKHKAS